MKLRYLFALAILALAPLFGAQAFADQGSLCLPTVGTVSGLTFVQDINSALQALVTSNSGASAPANPCAAAPQTGQFWLDGSATPAHLRIFDGANFLDMGAVDAVSHIWTPPVGAGATTLASASTVNLGSVPQSFINVSGTTPVTSFGSSMVLGSAKVVRATGAFSITYNATSMILPGGASITAAAGDTFLVISLGGGNSLVAMYQRADGSPLIVNTANIAAGAVTGAKIATNTVANSNLAQMAAGTLKGNAGTSTANAADINGTQAAQLPGIAPIGWITGLTLSNDSGTPASLIDVSTGQATANNTGTSTMMTLGSAYTKSITSAWAVGTGNGCFDTGSIANPSTVHFFLIERPDTGVDDILCSASATSPTLPTNYTLFRRIGSDIYASSALKLFQQDGDYFAWAFVDSNISGITSTKALTVIDVPTGIRIRARLQTQIDSNTSSNNTVTLNTWDGQNPNVLSLSAMLNGGSVFGVLYAQIEQFDNTSGQIYTQQTGGSSVPSYVMGWTDTRGK